MQTGLSEYSYTPFEGARIDGIQAKISVDIILQDSKALHPLDVW
jgi:hypothetical protein